MPHTTHAPLLLIVAGLALIALAAGAMLFAGRALRAQVASKPTDKGRGPRPSNLSLTVSRGAGPRQSATGAASANPAPAPPSTTGVARTLAERGLVTAQQLASMSPGEREFFLATMAAKLGDGRKPRLMQGASAASGASAAAAASPAPPEVVEPPEPIPQAALVSGGIHCPVCRTPIGQRADTPLLMSRCPGCSRRVGARIEGDRLTVTVEYTLRTPAAGVPVTRGRKEQ
jgi:hypothetical protein